MGKSSAKSQIEEKQRDGQIESKNIDRRKAKRWTNQMQTHRQKKNKEMDKLNAKSQKKQRDGGIKITTIDRRKTKRWGN